MSRLANATRCFCIPHETKNIAFWLTKQQNTKARHLPGRKGKEMPKTVYTQDFKKATIKKMFQRNWSIKETARRIGVSKKTIEVWKSNFQYIVMDELNKEREIEELIKGGPARWHQVNSIAGYWK